MSEERIDETRASAAEAAGAPTAEASVAAAAAEDAGAPTEVVEAAAGAESGELPTGPEGGRAPDEAAEAITGWHGDEPSTAVEGAAVPTAEEVVEPGTEADDAEAGGAEGDWEALAEERPTAEEEAIAQARDEEGEEPPAEIAEPEEEGDFEKLEARARRLSDEQVRHVVHSLLFVSDKPLTVARIREVTGLPPARIQKALDSLSGELREGISGVILVEVAGGWQLRTAPESAEYVRRLLRVKPRRLTRAALETLAIIAYRQPITRPEIEEIRGVDCGAVIKALLDWKLIKILGKKDEVGRPLLYGTTREFLEFFQLKDLASLPTLREYYELTEESQAIVEEELGPEALAGIQTTIDQLVDPAYVEAERARIEKSETALAELEQAVAEAEEKSRSVEEVLGSPATGTDGD